MGYKGQVEGRHLDNENILEPYKVVAHVNVYKNSKLYS